MTFLNMSWLPLVLIALGAFWFLVFKSEKKYFVWVADHWFLKRSFPSLLSSYFYFGGFALILLALLDPRGPEKLITGKVGDQKTVLLIDASASMLAEDVRPNRFEKAALLAKHFIKKSAGHQLSVVVFSDGQKRIVPFTNDKDLVEARLDTLGNLDLERGGTGLSLALQETIQYFKDSDRAAFGNILILTDAEETDGGFDLEVPDGISVAVVGIGTAKGAPIPLRSPRGGFRGNKKHNGQTVITKLDETFLKSLGEKIEHFKYWVATSYTLPTEDILEFFNRSMKTKTAKNDFRIRPVLANYFLVPGVLLLLASFFLKNLRSFGCLLVFLAVAGAVAPGSNHAAEGAPQQEPEKNQLILELEERFAENKLDVEGKKKLAAELLANNFPEQAKKLYSEILKEEKLEPDSQNYRDLFNLGTAQFKTGDIEGGMATYSKLMDSLEKSSWEGSQELLEKSKKNVLKAISAQSKAQKQKKKSQGKQDGEEKDSESDGQSGESGSSKDRQDKTGKSKGGKDKKEENKDGQDGQKENEKERKNDKGEKDKEGDSKKNQMGKEEKEKMPSILKQLMSDDNQLQKKVIDAETVKRKTRQEKDW